MFLYSSYFSIKNYRVKEDYFRLEKGEESGPSDKVLNCPKIFITDDDGNLVDLGSAKIEPIDIISPINEISVGRNFYKIVIVFQFKDTPNDKIKNYFTLISQPENKYLFNFRFFALKLHQSITSNLFYTPQKDKQNGYLNFEYTLDGQKRRKMKIILPYFDDLTMISEFDN